ncbi:hypothetical protein NIASO_06630 [Niabella soli DSM 19437]|uniref:Uncharacterized protein n=1 Tax=Niabella soli DSM 19437 TaxID=929713 RepID=W0F7E7_9BACT|nr:hypothetical protein NIASO_06630 [Niabella soli DSM 19437]
MRITGIKILYGPDRTMITSKLLKTINGPLKNGSGAKDILSNAKSI